MQGGSVRSYYFRKRQQPLLSLRWPFDSNTDTITKFRSRGGVASMIWACSILLSRIMGLVREQIIGRTLGATRQADVYFASFTLPDFLNYLLAAGVSPA